MSRMLVQPSEDDLHEVIRNLGHFQKVYNLSIGDMMSGNLGMHQRVESRLTRK